MVESTPRILAGRYEVGELIGRGGMAEVHIGYDSRLSRTVAIKLLRTDLAQDSIFHARFRREAQSAAALNHPAIVAVYDTGEESVLDTNGNTTTLPFIVMEYVEGHTVRELLKEGAAVPIDEAVEITVGVLGALEYAHNEGIVHRDIKPGNVMLTPTGQVKVMDFGIARAMADSQATMTQTNSVVGTAQYLSPEQARGETVDARSDLYSTGCLLYELLTGRPPFQGDSPVSVAYQHVREIPVVPSKVASDVPDSLDRVVMKALAKDRDERYLDANQFRTDLLAILHGGSVSAPATNSWLAPPVGASATAIMTPASAPVSAPTPPSVRPPTDTLPPARPLDDTGGRGGRWWVWVLALVGLAALVVAGFFLLNGEKPANTVTVPDVTGKTLQEASNMIENQDLIFAQGESEPSTEVDTGLAIRSDPPANEEVEKGSTVTVIFSAGPEEVIVPDVKDKTQDEARALLTDAKLVVSSVRIEDAPGVERDQAVRTEPAAGEAVPRDSQIILYVGSGEVVVKELEGLLASEAKNYLEQELKLTVRETEEESEDRTTGTVIRTEPGAGKVPIDSTVTIVVSKGPANKPPEITGANDIEIEYGSEFNVRDGVQATDPEEGDITARIEWPDPINTNLEGPHLRIYRVTDNDGATTTVRRNITVLPAPPPPTTPPPTTPPPTTEPPTSDPTEDEGEP